MQEIMPKYNEGSSPRVWGQVVCVTLFLYGLRIIPTRMGTSRRVRQSVQPAWDHPHAYGDKTLVAKNTCVSLGSSPRVWGQAVANILRPKEFGIIPTRMGTSFFTISSSSDSSDHPHAYGDKLTLSVLYLNFQGSSPRVWGQVRF